MFWLEKFNRKWSLNKKVYDNIKITVIVLYKNRQLYNELKYTKTEYLSFIIFISYELQISKLIDTIKYHQITLLQ